MSKSCSNIVVNSSFGLDLAYVGFTSTLIFLTFVRLGDGCVSNELVPDDAGLNSWRTLTLDPRDPRDDISDKAFSFSVRESREASEVSNFIPAGIDMRSENILATAL